MKQKISSDHFKNYLYPCGLQAIGGSDLAYGTYTVDMEKDKYVYKMQALRGGAVTETPLFFDAASFVSYQPEGWFLVCEKDDKGSSTLSRSDGRSQDKEELLTVPRDIYRAFPLPDGRFLLLCWDDLRAEGLSPEELAAREGYYELEEYPFWANGAGMCERKRTRLYLWTRGELKRLTPDFMDVGAVAVLGDKAVLSGTEFRDVNDKPAALWTVDLITLALAPVPNTDGYTYTDLVRLDDQHVFCLRSDHKKYGESQNDFIDLLDIETGEFCRANESADLSICNALYSDILYGASSYAFARYRDGVFFIATSGDAAPVLYTDPRTGKMETWVGGDFVAAEAVLSTDESTLYFIAEKGGSGPEIWARDMDTGEIRQLTHLNDRVQEEYITLPVETFTFAGADGAPIAGFYIKPLGFEEGKRYKSVISIHGGPACTFGRCYYMELQYLATLGYAVLFCNPHGSVGYGGAFQDLREKYYTCDLEDILDLVAYARRELPFVDCDQMAVTGGSYGGMMVNWIITHYDMFKTAISDRGCANELEDFFMSDCGLSFSRDVRGGTIWDEGVFDKVWAASPIRYADRVKTPTLFIHSENDYRCTKEQSLSMFAALKLHGVKTRAYIFKGEDHGMCFSGKPKNRAARFEIIRQWLEETL